MVSSDVPGSQQQNDAKELQRKNEDETVRRRLKFIRKLGIRVI